MIDSLETDARCIAVQEGAGELRYKNPRAAFTVLQSTCFARGETSDRTSHPQKLARKPG